MAIVEGYPELNFYGNDATEWQDTNKEKEKESRSLFALETQLQKTKLCRYHTKGLCKHGSECRFAHGKDELHELPNLQKTRMCPNLLANGHCGNEACTFAHDENELKKVNICRKTVVCTWYLAGKCRNGTECDFAHGEHELKGVAANNANRNFPPKTLDAKDRMPEVQKPKQMPRTMPDNNGYKRREPMFIQPSITASNVPMPPAYYPPEGSQFPENSQPCQFDGQFQSPLPQAMPQWPAAPPPPPPGFMPNYMAPCFGAYSPLQPEMMAPNYMSMQHAPMMQPYAGVEAMTSLPPGLSVGAVAAPSPAQLVPPDAPGDEAQKSWQLTELAVQFNMLSEEVKRLQDCIIPQSMQSTNSGTGSGCSTRSSSGDNRTPRAVVESSAATSSTGGHSGPVDANDRRSFKEKVAHLQNELKQIMDEGQRCGKFFQTHDQDHL